MSFKSWVFSDRVENYFVKQNRAKNWRIPQFPNSPTIFFTQCSVWRLKDLNGRSLVQCLAKSWITYIGGTLCCPIFFLQDVALSLDCYKMKTRVKK